MPHGMKKMRPCNLENKSLTSVPFPRESTPTSKPHCNHPCFFIPGKRNGSNEEQNSNRKAVAQSLEITERCLLFEGGTIAPTT